MAINHRINSGLWPTNDPLAGLVTNGLVFGYDPGIAGSLNNIVPNPADGQAQATYNMSLVQYCEIRGVAGRKSAGEYLRINGNSHNNEGQNTTGAGGYAAGGTLTSFITSLPSAGANWTMAFVNYCPPIISGNSYPVLLSTGTSWSGFAPGINILQTEDAGLLVNCSLNSPSWGGVTTKGPGVGRWNFQAVSLKDGSASFAYANGVQMEVVGSATTTFTPNMSGNGSSSATTFRLGTVSNSAWSTCGSRIGQVFAWNRALSKDELDQCFNAVRRRWGI